MKKRCVKIQNDKMIKEIRSKTNDHQKYRNKKEAKIFPQKPRITRYKMIFLGGEKPNLNFFIPKITKTSNFEAKNKEN